jgi:hypothetical protein
MQQADGTAAAGAERLCSVSDGKFGGNYPSLQPAAAAADITTEIPFDFGWRMNQQRVKG